MPDPLSTDSWGGLVLQCSPRSPRMLCGEAPPLQCPGAWTVSLFFGVVAAAAARAIRVLPWSPLRLQGLCSGNLTGELHVSPRYNSNQGVAGSCNFALLLPVAQRQLCVADARSLSPLLWAPGVLPSSCGATLQQVGHRHCCKESRKENSLCEPAPDCNCWTAAALAWMWAKRKACGHRRCSVHCTDGHQTSQARQCSCHKSGLKRHALLVAATAYALEWQTAAAVVVA
mmetsp:Transcript_103294/g.200152  ORF Transcript_103294/g.200152 Transcript_103294/m.200152 type:complete len:229 (+) Transcript_103294:151-837(+)